ncbi:DUF4192 domain-containing protein [Microlunatus soli]|uniref:DUF4192 domain-containing protein n=1 Tax=Microlunatus soli TaxID=630515 RepID=A0A1H1YIB0_9ACTN|nr:DUF4192 domain-containing protein [Microlunatus soli]SDT21101.1 protein of unknown function [Microlunatus soli]
MPTAPPPPDPGNSGAEPRRLKAEDPDDLLAVLPFLLGYQPSESLVMAAVCDKVIAVCVRVDLAEDPDLVSDRLAEIATNNHASGVLLVAYSDEAARADRLLLPMIDRLQTVGVIDAIYTDGQRRWSRICNADCCPPEGIPYRLDTNRLAAEAVFQGMSRQTDRAAIAELVQGPPAERRPELSALTEQVIEDVFARSQDERRREIAGWVSAHVRRRLEGLAVQPTERELVRLACLIVDVPVRDEAWALMRRQDAWVHVELWQQVVSHAVSPLDVPALGMLGMAAWISGQGTLQVCCIERARQLDTNYSLIDILDDINDRALPPTFWESIRSGVAGAIDDDVIGAGTGTDARPTAIGPHRRTGRRPKRGAA